MKLTKTIFLYLNEKEFSMLTKDAERANMSMSRYIRHQIDNAKMKPTLDMDYEKYINLLEPICDKLSIVSKRVWQIKMLDTVMLREVLKSTNEIMPEIIKAKEVAQCVQEREESQLEYLCNCSHQLCHTLCRKVMCLNGNDYAICRR